MTVPIEPLEPVCVTVEVPVDPDRAFQLFTAEIDRWWPLGTHSVGEERSRGVAFEPQVGGGIVETIEGAESALWGTVLRWEPPQVLAFAWHPAGTPDQSTAVLVRFTATAGGTQVAVDHVGWEQLEQPFVTRAAYVSGWPLVIGNYVAYAGAVG
jgi:uncharacterized protein YndB with AHSA1/START domain